MITTRETKFDSNGILSSPTIQSLILAVCIKKLGGEVHITQELIDEVAYGYLIESRDPETSGVLLSWKNRPKQGQIPQQQA